MSDFSVKHERYDSAGNRIIDDAVLFSAGPVTRPIPEPELTTIYVDAVQAKLDAWMSEHGFEPTFKVTAQEWDSDRTTRTIQEVEIVDWTSSPDLWEAFVAGFEASGEGWNGEYRGSSRPDDVRKDPGLGQAFNKFLSNRERITRY